MRARAVVTTGLGVLGVVAVLGYGWRRTQYLQQVDNARASAENVGVATKVHMVLPGEEPIAAALVQKFSMAEGHDGQMLKGKCFVSCDNYDAGPVEMRVDSNVERPLGDFANALVVAHISVNGGTKFDDFGLDGGAISNPIIPHLLMLKSSNSTNPSDPRFEAWVERNGTNVKSLKVTFVPKPQNATRDIPTAATFFWYPRGALRWDLPLIGVKCPGGWCFIGNEEGVPNWSASGQTKSRCTSEDELTDCVDVFGFHDEQRLAVSAGANGKKKLGDSWGLILPEKDLASKDIPAFDASEVTVATIRIWGRDYVKSFTLPAKAQLRVKLRHSGTLPNDGWTASMEAKLDGSSAWTVLKTGLAVTREAHTDPVIGAARWEWDPNDEGVWVRCAAGCCKVTL